jgi:DNA-binding SARP family transcriptional activator
VADALRRRRRVADVVGASVTALVVFVAVPAVLAVVVGNPLGDGLGHALPPASRDALCAAVLAAWIAWAACCAQLIRAVAARVRRGETNAPHGASVLDRLAARIAIGVLAMSSVGVAAPVAVVTTAGASAPAVSAVAGPERSVEVVHTVRRGDSLWRIARERLDDDGDWTAIAALNLGADMVDGARLVDPDHLRAGWRLHLPDTAREAASHPGGPAVVRRDTGRLDARLPELVALGAGSLACAALARRARRRRQEARVLAEPDRQGLEDPGPALSPGAVDAAALLGRFEGVAALRAFEMANVLLGAGVDRNGSGGPSVCTICVGPDGVTFWLRSPTASAPPGFDELRDGAAWHVRHHRLGDVPPGHPHVPVALPVGDDEEGTWLLALEPGDVVPLLGASAAALWRSARAAQESWAWADSVVVADTAHDPRLAVSAAADPVTVRRVLYFGHPASLPPALARRASVVTADAVAGSDLSVLVDERAATIHPIGRVVRPHLMSEVMARNVDEVVGAAPADAAAARPGSRAGPATAAPARPDPMHPSGPLGIAPGAVDVRLLTMTPRLDGLCEELPPNRVRRAVELVAYLALHHPDVVTGDRLRTRVLGSADADAAAKTLFNTAHAARRAMGLDERGDPLFPSGSRTGLYQLSSAVTVDVRRAIELVGLAKTRDEPDVAIASYRGALELVEGEPLANALAGYTWWEAEGHAGRIAAVLVDAACSLAALAADRGLFDLARWGLGRARLVAPYSEALSRAAMELAAAEGDADGLRVEWRQCQRMVDALDPGGSPSQRTETLYGELSRRMLVPAGGPGDGPAGATPPAASDCTPAASP